MSIFGDIKSVGELIAAIKEKGDDLKEFWEFLKESENLAKAHLEAAKKGEKYKIPAGAKGRPEFGMALYWLTHPTSAHKEKMAQSETHAMVFEAMRQLAPESSIDEGIIQEIEEAIDYKGYVTQDGELFAFGKYAQLDANWLWAPINYFINKIFPSSVHAFGENPYSAVIPVQLEEKGDEASITIAILGDWGSGPYNPDYAGKGPAVTIMDQVRDTIKPDFVIHVGDVYYSGTDDRIPMHEEQENLLDCWKTGLMGDTSFTMNSNHEMYGGAQGLMGVALDQGTPFGHQNKTSYFGLVYGDWIVVGLDSAYYDPSELYMDGYLRDTSDDPQKKFVDKLLADNPGKKIIALTHHNPITYDGASVVANDKAGISLWDGMSKMFGGKQPDYWYYGHLHLNVVYTDLSATKGATKARCVGASAIPNGDPWGIKEQPQNVDYYNHTNLGLGNDLCRNGFATITLFANGEIGETFYEVDAEGKCHQMWTNALSEVGGS